MSLLIVLSRIEIRNNTVDLFFFKFLLIVLSRIEMECSMPERPLSGLLIVLSRIEIPEEMKMLRSNVTFNRT